MSRNTQIKYAYIFVDMPNTGDVTIQLEIIFPMNNVIKLSMFK